MADDGERMYITAALPYRQLTFDVAHPYGEVLAAGAFRQHVDDHGRLRLFLNHAGDRAHYRIPAGICTQVEDSDDQCLLTFEAYQTSEGRRAVENSRESTPSVSPEIFVLREGVGPRHERVILKARIHGLALVADPAYPNARVTSVETATERRSALFDKLAATIARGETIIDDEARRYAGLPPKWTGDPVARQQVLDANDARWHQLQRQLEAIG